MGGGDKEERVERGKKLAGTACQIHSRSQHFIASPHLTINCLKLVLPDRFHSHPGCRALPRSAEFTQRDFLCC